MYYDYDEQRYTGKDGKITLVDMENSNSVNGIPIAQFMANCHGLTFGDGEFVIDADGAGTILRDEYIDIGYQDIGMDPKDIPSHDVMTVGGSTIRGVWEPFHSATSKKDGYRSKDTMNAVRTGENREDATNYVKYEKGSDGFNEIMKYLRKYYKKNENEEK